MSEILFFFGFQRKFYRCLMVLSSQNARLCRNCALIYPPHNGCDLQRLLKLASTSDSVPAHYCTHHAAVMEIVRMQMSGI